MKIMIFDFFRQLSNVSGLPQIVLVCALVITFSLTLFGILILVKIRSIKKVLDNLNNRLDIISERFGWRSEEFETVQSHNYKSRFYIKNKTETEARTSIGTNQTADITPKSDSEEYRTNREISTKIHELLKKSGKPTPYHDLTKHLSEDYPGYNYDFFLKEVEDLQKEGKVEVQLIAGKLYFQIKKA